MTQVSVFDIFRPFVWIGAFAFVVGFAGYLFLSAGKPTLYGQASPATLQASAITSPPPMDLRAV